MSAATKPPVTGWRRWSAYLALTVVFALTCGLLSWWQWARRAETAAENQRIERNYDAEPRPIDELLPRLDAWDDDDEWTRVELRGEYLVEDQLLVRNRVLGGSPGFEQLVPFRLADGAVVVLDRVQAEQGGKIELTPVLFVDGDTITHDEKALAKVKVTAEVIGHERGKKIVIQKFKNKTGYKKRQGHRSELTRVKITGIK